MPSRLALLTALVLPLAAQAADLPAAFETLTGSTAWQKIGDGLAVPFEDHHPQGMVKIGDDFYLSTVRIAERPAPYAAPQDGYDRSPGKGSGFLLKISGTGELLGTTALGEGDIYHPGGLDFDGTSIWVPVAEYRPNSASIVYRVDPATMKATEIFRFADHLGGLTVDRENHRLHAVSWGSRRFYQWDLGPDGNPVTTSAGPVMNPSFYIDYQDCHYAGPARMLCGGLNKYGPDQAGMVAVGGLDLVDLDRNAPVHQVPVKLWLRPDLVMTNNPQFCEAGSDALDCWFAPEDDRTRIYHYRAALPKTN